jgi:hypothetical protein
LIILSGIVSPLQAYKKSNSEKNRLLYLCILYFSGII